MTVHSELLLRYVAGDATAEESAAVEAWAETDPANSQQLRVVASAWREAVSDAQAAPAGDWVRFARRLQEDAASHDPVEAPNPGTSRRQWLTRAAAVLLLAAGAATFALSRTAEDAASPTAWATATGETRDIVLPDGSQVRLGPSSELQLRSGFGEDGRHVVLRGTALFDVRRAEPQTFTVDAGGVRTTVLGTRFVIRAYEGDDGTDVAVVEGRVAVAASAEAAELGAGDGAHVEGGRIRVERADMDALLGWRERRIIFRNATLAAAARELERWYEVEVDFADASLRQRRITMTLDAAPLPEVLQLMEAAAGVTITRNGGRVIIGEAR